MEMHIQDLPQIFTHSKLDIGFLVCYFSSVCVY